MTKDEIVKQTTDANTLVVFTLLSGFYPVLKVPIVSWVVKYYLAKWLRPLVNEGTVFIAFKTIDWAQLQKAQTFAEAMKRLSAAVSKDGVSVDLPDAEKNFDDAFRDAIRLRP